MIFALSKIMHTHFVEIKASSLEIHGNILGLRRPRFATNKQRPGSSSTKHVLSIHGSVVVHDHILLCHYMSQ